MDEGTPATHLGRNDRAALQRRTLRVLTVGQLVGALAQLLEVDEAALAADLLPRVRELVVTGFLGLA